jgi:hypothetical protein
MHHTDPGEEEHVALVAVLGEQAGADPRRMYAGWSAIAAELVRRGSALAVRNERDPLTLDGPGGPTPRWCAPGPGWPAGGPPTSTFWRCWTGDIRCS